MFCGEEGVHSGSVSSRYAAADGTNTTADTVHENCASITVHVPQATGTGAKHLTKTNKETGKLGDAVITLNACI